MAPARNAVFAALMAASPLVTTSFVSAPLSRGRALQPQHKLFSTVKEDVTRQTYCDDDLDCDVADAASAEADRLMAEVAKLRAELEGKEADLVEFKEETKLINKKGGEEAAAPIKADMTTFEQLEPRWTLRMNVGREDDVQGAGHMLAAMSDRDWGASGTRLMLDLDVAFENAALPSDCPPMTEVGPAGSIKVAKAATSTAKYISDCGQQVLSVGNGGWFITEKSDKPSELKFWLELMEPVGKSDVHLDADRIVFTTSVWTDSELTTLRGQLEEAKLNGQAAEKEMDAEGENPMTILKYNQALSKVQELQAKLPEAGEGTKKGGWVGDESLNLSMRGLLSIQKKSNSMFSLIFPTSQQCIGKFSSTPNVGEHTHLENSDFSKYY